MLFFKSKVFLKILVSYAIILVIPVLLIGGINYNKTVGIVDTQMQKINLLTVEKIRDSYDKTLKDINKIGIMLNQLPWLNRILYMGEKIDSDNIEFRDLVYLSTQLRNNKVSNNIIKNIAVVFRNGDFVIDCDAKYSIEEYFSNKCKYSSNEFNGHNDINWEVNLTKYITDCEIANYGTYWYKDILYMQTLPPGEKYVRALVLIQIDQEKMKDVLKQFSLGKNTGLLVLDDKNNVFLSYGEFDSSIIPKIKLDSAEGYGTANIEKTQYAYYYVDSRYNKFKYLAVVDRKSITAQADNIKMLTYFLVVCSLALGFILSYLAAMNNYRPIRNLVNTISSNHSRTEKRVNEIDLIEQAFKSLSSQKDRLIKDIESYKPVIRNNMLQRLLKGIESKENIDKELNSSGIYFKYPGFCVGIIEIDVMDKMISQEPINSNALSTLLIKYIEDFFEANEARCYVVENDPYLYAAIINTECSSIQDIAKKVDKMMDNLKESLKSHFEIVVACGLGSICKSYLEIPYNYNEAKKAIEYKFARSNSEVICYDSIEEKGTEGFDFLLENEIQLINLLRTGEMDKVNGFVDEILSRNFVKKNISKSSGMYIFNELMSVAVKVLKETDANKINMINYYELSSLKSYNSMVAYIKDLFRQICDIINLEKKGTGGNLLKEVIGFIDEKCYNSNISLTMLEDKFNYSGVYISKLIRDHFGYNFIEYINRKRIDKAKELLRNPDIFVKDIAFSVGYDNDITFRRIFKKLEAISPGEFRETVARHIKHW